MWLFGFSVLYSLRDESMAKITYRFLYTGVTLIPIIFFHFIHRFLYIKNCNKKILVQYIIGGVFLLGLYLTNDFLVGLQRFYWGYQTKAGFLNHIFLIYFFSIFIYCFTLLRRFINDPLTNPIEKNRIRYIFWAFVIALTASSDWLPVYGIEFYPLGFIFMTFFVLITSYAILKHQLFDIDIFIKRSFVYSFLISIITFIYISIILISEHVFRSYLGYRSIFIAIAASFFITIIFNPLRTRIQKFIDKYFYKMDPEKIMEENVKLMDVVQKQDQMKAVATLAAGMAHEIKNPLTSIKTFAEYLPEKYDDPGFREKFSRIVVDEVDRVNNIVKQLLEFSKPKELELKKEPIVPILDDTLNLLNSNLLKNKIEIVKHYKDNPIISVDKNQLKQAFLNLFLNAIQAMPNGGVLTVTTQTSHPERSKNVIPTELNRKTREWRDLALDSSTRPIGLPRNDNLNGDLVITISDTGYGIPKDQIPHIFDPFYTTKEDGTGLGLSIVHAIITKHGGKIEVKSAIDKGTLFNIRMPMR